MAGIFDSLKEAGERFGIIVDEDAPKGEVAENSAPALQPAPSTPSSSSVQTAVLDAPDQAVGNTTVTADPRTIETLNDTLKAVCSPGYLTFIDKLSEMGKIPGMPQSAQYQAAMVAANISGDEIRSNYGKMLTALAQEEKTVQETLDNKHSDLKTGTESQIGELEKLIASNNAQITELNASNDKAIGDINGMKAKLTDSESKTERKKSTFRAAVAQVRAKVEQDQNKAVQNSPVNGGV